MPFRLHLRVRRVNRDAAVTRRLVRWGNVAIRPVDVDPDEVEWRRDRLQLVVGELRRILAVLFQVVVGVPALEHHGGEVRVQLAGRDLGRLDVLGSLYDWNHRAHVFGKAYLRARPAAGADRLHGEAVAQHGVVAHLVELAVREPQPRRPAQVQGFSPTDLYVEPLVAALDEGAELIDREVML